MKGRLTTIATAILGGILGSWVASGRSCRCRKCDGEGTVFKQTPVGLTAFLCEKCEGTGIK